MEGKVAVWALTAQGAALADRTARALGADLFLPDRLKGDYAAKTFRSLGEGLARWFRDYRGHVIVAATGIAVRLIAPLAADKKTDPAVVTMGQDGRFVISLLSGHLGGANELARRVALLTGGLPVITTATDLQRVPALEVLAADLGLGFQDLSPLAAISRTLTEGGKIDVYDPGLFLRPALGAWPGLFEFPGEPPTENRPSVSVDYRLRPLPRECLALRPPALAVGLGCHRDCPPPELLALVEGSMGDAGLSTRSVAALATVDSRGGPDLAPAALAKLWRVPLLTFGPGRLSAVGTPNPSETVLRRIGAPSVCEASAILAARMGPLIMDKRKGARATCAVALMDYPSSASAPGDPGA
jgi:cobalt-precorrin 5A hydrolase